MSIDKKEREAIIESSLAKLAAMPFDVTVANAISYMLVASGGGRAVTPKPLRKPLVRRASVEARVLEAIDAPEPCYSKNDVVRVAGANKASALACVNTLMDSGVIARHDDGRFYRVTQEAA